jgi:hypothetical protein
LLPVSRGEKTGPKAMRVSFTAQRREGIIPARLRKGSASGGTTPIHCLSVSVTITPQRSEFYK